jgi:hypothetical protein
MHMVYKDGSLRATNRITFLNYPHSMLLHFLQFGVPDAEPRPGTNLGACSAYWGLSSRGMHDLWKRDLVCIS